MNRLMVLCQLLCEEWMKWGKCGIWRPDVVGRWHLHFLLDACPRPSSFAVCPFPSCCLPQRSAQTHCSQGVPLLLTSSGKPSQVQKKREREVEMFIPSAPCHTQGLSEAACVPQSMPAGPVQMPLLSPPPGLQDPAPLRTWVLSEKAPHWKTLCFLNDTFIELQSNYPIYVSSVFCLISSMIQEER